MILEDPDLFGSLDRRSVCAGRGGETFFVPEYAQLWVEAGVWGWGWKCDCEWECEWEGTEAVDNRTERI